MIHDMAVISAQALERIRTKGWVQGHLAPAGSDGPMCLGGTVGYIMTKKVTCNWRGPMHMLTAEIAQIIHEQFPDRVYGTRGDEETIIWFNDHSDTNLKDVQMVLEKLGTREGTTS